MAELVWRDPQSLKDHPAQRMVYGDGPTREFVANVRRNGVLEPLLILPDDTIISGHRRKAAAVKAGCEIVPCVIDEETDPEDEVAVGEKFLDANDQREKTPEQRAREFEFRKRLEADKAKKRQLASQNNDAARAVQEKLPEQARGQSRDIAAEAVGWSGRTAEKALKVVKAIDEAKAKGDSEKAKELRKTLNTQSVTAAYRQVEPPKPTRRDLSAAVRADREARSEATAVAANRHPIDKQINTHVGALVRAFAERNKVFPSRRHDGIGTHLDAVLRLWAEWKGEVAG